MRNVLGATLAIGFLLFPAGPLQIGGTTTLQAPSLAWVINAHSQVDSLAISGDGSTVMAGLDNGTAILLNSQGELTTSFLAPPSSSASGSRATNVGLSFNGSIEVANKGVYRDGVAIGTLDVGAGGYTVAPSENGSDFVTSSDQYVSIASGVSGSLSFKTANYSHAVEEVRALLTSDSSEIVVESEDTMLGTIPLHGPTPLGPTYTLPQPIVAFGASSDGSLLAATTTSGQVLFVRHGNSINFNQSILAISPSSSQWQEFVLHGVVIQNVAVPWNGNFVALSEADGFLGIYNPVGGVISREQISSGPIQAVVSSSDGGSLAIASGSEVSLYATHGLEEPVNYPAGPTCSLLCLSLVDAAVLLIGVGIGALVIWLAIGRRKAT